MADMAASVLARLKNKAKESGRSRENQKERLQYLAEGTAGTHTEGCRIWSDKKQGEGDSQHLPRRPVLDFY